MRKLIWLPVLGAGIFLALSAQTGPDIRGVISESSKPVIAVPDLKGVAEAQGLMGAFNQTLWADVSGSGIYRMVSKSQYPLFIPQQPTDFVQPPPPPERQPRRGRRDELQAVRTGGGRWMTDWSGPPVSATNLAFGYTAVQNGVLVLYGWLFDLRQGTPGTAQMFAHRYMGSVDEAGARKIAHEFAADIIAAAGGKSLFGSHIYFVSDRTGHKEIWVMDPDGKNQKQITHFNSISIEPAVSPDGTKIAFTSFYRTNPGIFVFSVDPVRDLRFYNQRASVNSSPSFTPDGKQIVYSSSAPGDTCCRIFIANVDGSGWRPLTTFRSIDTEPKVNPKTGREVLFSSGRSGPEQIYMMNIDGTNVERVSEGTGEAAGASWSPDGQKVAFSWTRGYAAGAWNIFVMDIGSKKPIQLTHGEGKNEHPSWAPDGVHIVFASTRGGRSQVYTMLADGTQVQQLTTSGHNERPTWGK
jgi:TolB protein